MRKFLKEKGGMIFLFSLLSCEAFGYAPTFVPSGSMEPTIDSKAYVMVNKHAYGLKVPFTKIALTEMKGPERNDVAVFKYPEDEGTNFIKRIVAVPGDTLYFNDHDFKVNFRPRDIDNYTRIVIPKGKYFAIGDNINNSHDSRYWGFVPLENFVGKYVGNIVEFRKIL